MKTLKRLTVTLSVCWLAACAAEPTTSTDESSQEISTTAASVWVSVTESCRDFFNRPCTSTFPSPQCPPAVTEGAVCSGTAQCFRTLSPTAFKIFDCVPI